MSKPRALVDLMTAVDAGLVAVDVDVNSASFASRRRAIHRRGRQRAAPPAKKAPVETPPTSSADASFEFSAVGSYSSASPASMVFSDGQLRAHQFPAVASPARSSSMGSAKAAAATTGRPKKRVSFAADRRKAANAVGDAQMRKGGGLMGCMGSACGLSANDVEEPAKNANRKVVAGHLVGLSS